MNETTYTASDRKRELNFIIQFAKTEDFYFESTREQLRCLWIAYCLHNDYRPDTRNYDGDISPIWTALEQNSSCPWKDDDDEHTNGFTLFDLFMGDPMC